MDINARSIEISLSGECTQTYKELADKHLQKNNITIEVLSAGQNEDGSNVYGICMIYPNGLKEWYDPHKETHNAIAGWDNKDDARVILESKVLPNLGYLIHQRDLQLFHRNMN